MVNDMKNGIYKCLKEYGEADATIKFKETKESYILTLISDDSRYPSGHIEMLFKNSPKAVINKKRSPHGMVTGDDWFTIYPFRAGMPFLFEFQESAKT